MTTYTIPLERISLQQDEPVNIRTMHTRASALPTQNEFEAFASLSPANTTKRATSAFLDRVLKYLQFDKHDSELIAEARALTLLAQHLTWAELATELKSYADTNQEFTYSKDLFWRKKRDIYSSKFQSHYAQRQDIGSVLRDAISRNHNNDQDNAVQRDNTDEDSVYDIPQNRSRNSNNANRNSGNNQRNNNRNQNNNHNIVPITTKIISITIIIIIIIEEIIKMINIPTIRVVITRVITRITTVIQGITTKITVIGIITTIIMVSVETIITITTVIGSITTITTQITMVIQVIVIKCLCKIKEYHHIHRDI